MSQKGFTLLELILGLFLLLLLTSLFPLIIHSIPSNYSIKSPNFFEKTLFLNQLSMEVSEATSIIVQGNTLILMKPNGTTVLFEKFGTLVRRRVNSTGHEVMLTRVKEITFTETKDGIVIVLVDEDGAQLSKRLSRAYVLTKGSDNPINEE